MTVIYEGLTKGLSSVDRFDLEESINDCWSITKDLDLLLEAIMERPEPLTTDELSNFVLGLKSIYGLKFEKLWFIFEQMVKSGQFTDFQNRPPWEEDEILGRPD